MITSRCPSCDAALPKPPQRKARCKICLEFMFVRATPEDRTRRLMTAAQAEAADLAWQQRAEQEHAGRLAEARRIEYEKLEKMLNAEAMGVVLGVHVQQPAPWPPASEMLRLAALGHTVQEIAAATGFSTIIVKSKLQTGGIDPRVTPECELLGARLYRIEDAIRERPIPCKENCICHWRPVLRSDVIR